MKKLFNTVLHINESTFVGYYLFFMAFLFLLYLVWLVYMVHLFFNTATVEKQDVVVLYSGLRIQKKVLPFLRNQVFVRR